MSKYYRGFWSFAPLDECTTHMVEANNEEEAVEMLIAWALENQGYVDEPMDFEVEELDSKKLELALKIVSYDPRYNEYDGTVWKIYKAIKNPKALAEMARDYVGELRHRQDIIEDFQSYTPRQRTNAEYDRTDIITILSLIREITMREVA